MKRWLTRSSSLRVSRLFMPFLEDMLGLKAILLAKNDVTQVHRKKRGSSQLQKGNGSSAGCAESGQRFRTRETDLVILGARSSLPQAGNGQHVHPIMPVSCVIYQGLA